MENNETSILLSNSETALRLHQSQLSVQSRGSSTTLPPRHASRSMDMNTKRPQLGKLVGCACVGLCIYLIPAPDTVPAKGWNLLAIFASTIAAIIIQPLDVGAIALISLGICMITQVLTFSEAFSAFSTDIPWLIATAFFLSRGFINTGLGNRLAFGIVALCGHSSLSLTYSLVFVELFLAPAIPSVAARTGGIFAPICESLCIACGSDPKDRTERKLGSYLITTMFQTSCISSSMFLTAMAANPLAAQLGEKATGHPPLSWGTWALAASVPGLICIIAAPLTVFAINRPEMGSTPRAPERAKEELSRLGPMSKKERIMALTMVITVCLWMAGSKFGVNSVSAALVGLTILICTNVITWKECLAEAAAWDTLVWFSALVAMAQYLNTLGFIPWFCEKLVGFVSALGFTTWPAVFVVISLLYFYAHYFFASSTAQIGAMYSAFLTVMVKTGTPPMLACFTMAVFSNLMGCLTHYGFGSAPAYFGTKFVSLRDWWVAGFACSVVNVTVFLIVGPIWWRMIGLY